MEQEFEEAFRAQSDAPDFIINDLLVKGADGQYWHQKTRDAFKWFKIGKGEQDEKA